MDNQLFSLKGKTVLITGSSRGLGRVLAEGFLEVGASVIFHGRDPEKMKAQVKNYIDQGYNAFVASFDITDQQAAKSGIKTIFEEAGPIDILVNNAGVQIRAPLESFPIENWNAIIETNLTGAFILSQLVFPMMKEQKGGKIINICSLQSELGRPSIAPYSAAKGGLKMLTRAMATEWAPYNIQVNGIGPGYFITDMTRSLVENPEFDKWIKKRTPAARWGYPEELVGTALFLASKASSFINGQIIYVDGGLLACI